jgi:hypothetical protein
MRRKLGRKSSARKTQLGIASTKNWGR